MRAIVLLLAVLFPFLTFAQCDPASFGKLKAEVHGDTVIVKNDTAYRNCGVNYSMGISKLSNDTLVWMQNDNGSPAFCLCHYNYSVTIDSLKPGNYFVKVYYSDKGYNDTCYIGTVSFTITGSNAFSSFSLRSEEKSSCFTTGVPIENKPVDEDVKISPNPVVTSFTVSSPAVTSVRIFNLLGQEVLASGIEYPASGQISISAFSSGIYFVKLKTTTGSEIARKLLKE